MDKKDKRSVNTRAVEEEEEEEVNERNCSPLISSNQTKCCTDCQTTTTPLWRGGPAGPKSLCNACRIKFNRKRRAQMKGFDRKSKITEQNGDLKLKVRLMVVNKKQQNHNQQQRKRSSYERGKPWWNKLREEEQAAILLMAISCGGSLYWMNY